MGPIRNLISRFEDPKTWKGITFNSFDLSAATDRLPIDIQKSLIALLYDLYYEPFVKSTPINFGEDSFSGLKLKSSMSGAAIDFSNSWADLLVGRFYSLQLSKEELKKLGIVKPGLWKLKYAVGQPMGALSS